MVRYKYSKKGVFAYFWSQPKVGHSEAFKIAKKKSNTIAKKIILRILYIGARE